MKKYLVSLLLALSFGSFAQSQYSISFAEDDIIDVDTTEFNSLIPLELYLINTGWDTIFNSVFINYMVANGTNQNVDDLDLNSINNLFEINFSEQFPFAPGDSFYFNSEGFDISLDGLYIEVSEERSFNVGDNIIIVWPVISNDGIDNLFFTTDQYIKEIYVPEPLTVKDNQKVDFSIFSRPQNLQIKSTKKLDKIRIYGINGQLVYEGNERLISTQYFTEGIYVFHVQFEGGNIQFGRVYISKY